MLILDISSSESVSSHSQQSSLLPCPSIPSAWIESTLPDSTQTVPRLQLGHILRESEIPYVVWFEDAIGRHSVPTVLFDLHTLVPDIQAAAAATPRAGEISSPSPRKLTTMASSKR